MIVNNLQLTETKLFLCLLRINFQSFKQLTKNWLKITPETKSKNPPKILQKINNMLSNKLKHYESSDEDYVEIVDPFAPPTRNRNLSTSSRKSRSLKKSKKKKSFFGIAYSGGYKRSSSKRRRTQSRNNSLKRNHTKISKFEQVNKIKDK